MDVLEPQVIPPHKTSTNKVLAKQSLPLDVKLLSKKLEVAKREQDTAQLRRQKNESIKKGGYVPQTAADQLISTTSTGNHVKGKPRRRSSSSNHGVGESHHRANGQNSTNLEQKHSAHCIERHDRQPMSSVAFPEKLLLAKLKSFDASESNNRDTRHIESWLENGARDRNSTRTSHDFDKLPDDLAERNCYPESATSPPKNTNGLQTKIVPIKCGTHLGYEHVSLGAPISAVRHHMLEQTNRREKRVTQLAIDQQNQERSLDDRSRLQSYNRPNWTQQSECGDAMHNYFTSHRTFPEVQEAISQLSQQPGSYPPSGSKRQRSAGDQGDTLIADAVSRIKEEKLKKRTSLVGLLKRL